MKSSIAVAPSVILQFIGVVFSAISINLTLLPTAQAQSASTLNPSASTYPRPQDVTSLDGIMHAYYDVVSGPANTPRDIARDVSLHHPKAQIFPLVRDKNGELTLLAFSIPEFHQWGKSVYDAGFYEREIKREVKTFGRSTQVWSTYETRATPDGAVTSRGINNIQLYFDGARYWILSETWDTERKHNPLPAQ
jgi:hypothetical protein